MIKFSENSEKILSEVVKGFSTIYIDTVLNAVFPEICCTLYTVYMQTPEATVTMTR